jgi:hypothetical protein
MSFSTTSGTVATRFSPANVSRGTPIVSGMVTSSCACGDAARCGTRATEALEFPASTPKYLVIERLAPLN